MYKLSIAFDTLDEAIDYICPSYLGDCPLYKVDGSIECSVCPSGCPLSYYDEGGNFEAVENALLKAAGWEKLEG